MLYHILFPLAKFIGPLNVFRYVTFRTAGAFLTALVLTLLLGPRIIEKLAAMRAGQVVREDGPQSHLKKAGTPTMGGVLILLAVTAATLLWAQLNNRFIWLTLLTTLAMGAVGFADDYLKVTRATSVGLRPRQKFVWQAGIGLAVGAYLCLFPVDGFTTKLAIPFLKRWMPELGVAYVAFAMLVIVGCSNAVNLTDGLDGLAIVPTLMAAATFTFLAYVAGNAVMAHYLQVIFVRGASELPVFAAALVGASLGFLWYNAHPAQVFMGDVGALSIGGTLATLAILIKQELLLFTIAGVFILEALSVLLQVSYFKMSGGKRIFKMAPLHHHFELSGWPEEKIVIRFWIVGIIFALFSLSTLKLR